MEIIALALFILAVFALVAVIRGARTLDRIEQKQEAFFLHMAPLADVANAQRVADAEARPAAIDGDRGEGASAIDAAE